MNKKVLITGGGGDIAQALKVLLEKENYIVFAPTKEEMDVTNWGSIEAFIKKFTPDILVNNAGYVVPKSVRNMDLINTKKHFDINIGGTFFVQVSR
jgi:dTDP-4-dehydrorhamnose reductase